MRRLLNTPIAEPQRKVMETCPSAHGQIRRSVKSPSLIPPVERKWVEPPFGVARIADWVA